MRKYQRTLIGPLLLPEVEMDSLKIERTGSMNFKILNALDLRASSLVRRSLFVSSIQSGSNCIIGGMTLLAIVKA